LDMAVDRCVGEGRSLTISTLCFELLRKGEYRAVHSTQASDHMV
jgi:hypothetical protein